MKSRWLLLGVGVLVVAGCGAEPRKKASASAEDARASAKAPQSVVKGASEVERVPRELAETRKSIRTNDLAAPGVDEGFTVTRQVVALERSVELYRMFIERAGDDPRYAEAVRRSKNRIEDARLTICFLRQEPCEGAEAR